MGFFKLVFAIIVALALIGLAPYLLAAVVALLIVLQG